MAQIPGIQLPPELGASLGGSPEDAAKSFMRAATKGLADVMASAVITAIGEAVGGLGEGDSVPDWTKLIQGCVLDLAWDTPPGTPVQCVTAFGTQDSNSLGSVTFHAGISGSF